MKHILLIGAGKSATVLIDYLKQIAEEHVWKVTVADNDLVLAAAKTGEHPLAQAVQLNILDADARHALIAAADLVISMMPPALHYLVADDCIRFKKHLLTASYIDDNIAARKQEIADAGLLFLCEMGLDPGIDHMSAMQLIHHIHQQGGSIESFKSHCGGLVAPESDNNPWHYKISWNPRNVVLAGKAGATFKADGEVRHIAYEHLFDITNLVEPYENHPELYAYYPNRDSLSYIPVYGLEETSTFVRTTIRHPDFVMGWKNIVQLHLTDEEKVYETDGMSIAGFFNAHFTRHGLEAWLHELMTTRLKNAKEWLGTLEGIIDAEIASGSDEPQDEMMVVKKDGELDMINLKKAKAGSLGFAALQIHEIKLVMEQLVFLGLEEKTLINKGLCSAADVLQWLMEQKLALQPADKDMIVMLHELTYTLHGRRHYTTSYLNVKGENSSHTAMAKTVGLPLGIAAKLILEGDMQLTGLHIPVIPEIYEPVLKELQQHGIAFSEETKIL